MVRRRPSTAVIFSLLVTLALVLAGCLGAAEDDTPLDTGDTDGTDPTNPAGDANTTDPDPGQDPDDDNETGGGPGPDPDGNETGGNTTTPGNNSTGRLSPHEWPAIGDQDIRPGIPLLIDGSYSCTANFVFRDPFNGTIYIGTAAHCVYEDVGTRVSIPNILGNILISPGETFGTVAYSSYHELGMTRPTGNAHEEINDFALIRVDDDKVDRVHPATLWFGGPTGLANSTDINAQDRVITHGATGMRPGPDELDRLEGIVFNVVDDWEFRAYFVPYDFAGDSGSGVMLRSGEAAGILVYTMLTPFPKATGVTTLAPALGFAHEHGYPVELQTWDQIDDGLVP